MAQQIRITACTDALLALLGSRLAATYDPTVDVKESGPDDFDDNGNLILKKIAVRIRLGEGQYGDTRDISRTTLSASLLYQVVCRHESLRSATEMRARTLALVEAVQEELAGARFLLGGSRTEPVQLEAVTPVRDKNGPVENCYAVSIRVSGFAQFDGRNSNPQPQAVTT